MAPVPAPRAGRTVASPRVSATSGLRAEPVGGRLAASSLSALLYSLNAPEWPAMAGRQAELRRVAAAAAAGTAVGALQPASRRKMLPPMNCGAPSCRCPVVLSASGRGQPNSTRRKVDQ